jgi:hypothetical protein
MRLGPKGEIGLGLGDGLASAVAMAVGRAVGVGVASRRTLSRLTS